MEGKYEGLIEKELLSCVKRTVDRMGKEETNRPFHEAMLSKDVLVWSRFERSFSTSFGQRTIEEMSRLAALSGGATDAKRQKETYFEIDTGVLSEINNVIDRGKKKKRLNWEDSLSHVEDAIKTGTMKGTRTISDLWWKRDDVDNYMSIKTVKPNIDQTAVAKEDCLKLKVFNPTCNVFFGLYYNPYGELREEYNHNPPISIFDMRSDPVVLIGKDYWDTLGGRGFYEELLELVKAVGNKTKDMIEGYSRGQKYF